MSLKTRISALERRFGMAAIDRPAPPDITVFFVRPLFDTNGNHVYGGERCDSIRASVNGTDYDRLPNETLEEFEKRLEKIPSGEFCKSTIMWPAPLPGEQPTDETAIERVRPQQGLSRS